MTGAKPQQPHRDERLRSSQRDSPVTAATQPVSKTSGLIQGLGHLGLAFVVLLIVRIIDEIFHPMFEEFERFWKPYELQLWGTAIGMTVLGFILMMGGILDLLITPQPESGGFTLQSM